MYSFDTISASSSVPYQRSNNVPVHRPVAPEYTELYSDSYINLLWYGSRHYDPELGRFTQPDSIVPDPSNSQAWDRFAYVLNNPVRYIDPSGHSWEDCGNRSGYRCNIHMNQVTKAKIGFAENLLEMMQLAFDKVDTIYLYGDALKKIQADPMFQKFRSELLFELRKNEEWREGLVPFHFYQQVIFGGERDQTASMLLQLLDSHNPEYAETWAVAKNELSWMLREAAVWADVTLTKEGKISISYTVFDIFDLKPQQGRGFEYNIISGTLGSVWHQQMGATAPRVYALWTETIEFNDIILNVSP